jgi:hypothetical protein
MRVERATCAIRTTHFQTPQKHYVLYGMATANKFAEPVRAKTRTVGCKTSFATTNLRKTRTVERVLAPRVPLVSQAAHALAKHESRKFYSLDTYLTRGTQVESETQVRVP